MTAVNILLYVALIGYVVFKKIQGQPIKAPKWLLGLPIILIVLGFGDLTAGKTMKPVEISVIAVGAVLSLGLGAMRGQADKLSTRDGVTFVQWGKASMVLFGVNIIAKLVLDIVDVAAGGNASAVGQSLVFTLGLTLLGEALVLLVRSGAAHGWISPRSSTAAQVSDGRSDFASPRPPRVNSVETNLPTPRTAHRRDAAYRPRRSVDHAGRDLTSSPIPSPSLVDAIWQHHGDHRERHAQRHARKHDRYRS
jgi:hypothetical protein